VLELDGTRVVGLVAPPQVQSVDHRPRPARLNYRRVLAVFPPALLLLAYDPLACVSVEQQFATSLVPLTRTSHVPSPSKCVQHLELGSLSIIGKELGFYIGIATSTQHMWTSQAKKSRICTVLVQHCSVSHASRITCRSWSASRSRSARDGGCPIKLSKKVRCMNDGLFNLAVAQMPPACTHDANRVPRHVGRRSRMRRDETGQSDSISKPYRAWFASYVLYSLRTCPCLRSLSVCPSDGSRPEYVHRSSCGSCEHSRSQHPIQAVSTQYVRISSRSCVR
jgi:hypothetical protein